MTLQSSWHECDGLVLSLGRKEPKSRMDENKIRNCLRFLSEIGFWNEERNELSRQGEQYFRAKHVLQDPEESRKILCDALMVYTPVQYICQTFWGRRALSSEQVENLLRHHQVLRKGETASSLLALLNHAGIITYSKRSRQIHVNINPFPDQGTDSSFLSHRVISPDTPYSNVKSIRQAIRSCE